RARTEKGLSGALRLSGNLREHSLNRRCARRDEPASNRSCSARRVMHLLGGILLETQERRLHHSALPEREFSAVSRLASVRAWRARKRTGEKIKGLNFCKNESS